MKVVPTNSLKKPSQISQERTKTVDSGKTPTTIGIPEEIRPDEKRLVFTPEVGNMMAGTGHAIFFETGAGVNYSDADYAESGVIITGKEAELIHTMTERTLNAIGYELLSFDGYNFPVPDSVSEIDGIAAISVASELLSTERGRHSGRHCRRVACGNNRYFLGTTGKVIARTALVLGEHVTRFSTATYSTSAACSRNGERWLLLPSCIHAGRVFNPIKIFLKKQLSL
jgi:alanine dehydrogenase